MLTRDDIKNPTSKPIDIKFPFINIRRSTNLSESTINYFLLGLCFAIYSFNGFQWFKNEKILDYPQFTNGIFLLSGISLCLVALYDWYQGRTIPFLIDFCFGLLFISYYLSSVLEVVSNTEPITDTKLESIFNILWFAFIFFILLCSKDKGILFIIDYAILFIGYVFVFVSKYWERYGWIKKTTNYIFLVLTAFFWITGILKLINDLCFETSIPLVEPPA